IDPPYNTDASPIDYKNGFREASWLSLMDERIAASKRLMSDAAVLVAAIDDAEGAALRSLLQIQFESNVLGTVPVRSNPPGRPTKRGFSIAHEYLHFAGRSEAAVIGRMNPTEEQAARFGEADELGVFEWRNLRREGSNSDRDARRALHYPLFLSDSTIRVPRMSWDEDTEEWSLNETPRESETIVLPIDDAGNEKTWRWSHEKVAASGTEIVVRKDRTGKNYVYYKRRPNEEGVVAVTAWFGARYSATEHGTALLKKLFGRSPFKYPKSMHAVADSIYVAGAGSRQSTTLDYFAGSGTTAHAVINLNRDDGGQRNFILVEQGEYFDTVTLPRVAKVMACPDWKDGHPKEGVQHDAEAGDEPETHWSRRTLPIVQVLRIERYEDSLDALALPGAAADAGQGELAGFDALLRYVADVQDSANPVRLSTAALA
ncbi:MAG: DNA methyltransferase, partial [Rubrivivax sp.]|nr:DNA methyltransferase [Rubrivivax sp.]